MLVNKREKNCAYYEIPGKSHTKAEEKNGDALASEGLVKEVFYSAQYNLVVLVENDSYVIGNDIYVMI
jgi:hypothetical protein